MCDCLFILAYVIYANIYVAVNDENDELLKTAAVISLVIAITLISSYIIIYKKNLKKKLRKRQINTKKLCSHLRT